MVGLCGVLGNPDDSADEMASDLEWTGREARAGFADSAVSVAAVDHPGSGRERPATDADEEVFLWVWGNVYGRETDDGYRSRRRDAETPARYCLDRYEERGLEFVDRLNGDFAGVVYDRRAGTVSVFTDRLATHDLYYARPADGTLVFSSRIQSLARHPSVTPGFAVDYLHEFFVYTRSMGVRTPLEGVSMFPPGTVTTFDLEAETLRTRRYWMPRHRPRDRPFSHFVDEFVDRYRAALAERVDEDGEYGVFLSGGSDSRVLLAAMGERARANATAYHMSDWMSREARTAERIAMTAGVDFELLTRQRDYLDDLLERSPALSNFYGQFTQAHAEGFMERVRGEVDAVVEAHYTDLLFKGWGIPRRSVTVDPVGTVTLPVRKSSGTVEDYVDEWARDPPAYLRTERTTREILREEIRERAGSVDHHGVAYESARDLNVWSHVVPQTNMGGGFFLHSLRQHLPHRNPLLDNRLIDLSLSMPIEYFLRRNVVNAAVERLSPALASIPHSTTGAPIDRQFPFDFATRVARGLARKFTPVGETSPAPHLTHHPWPPTEELLRIRPFVRETLADKEGLIRRLPFLDWEAANECYREHLAGANNTRELATLVTFLRMPVTERVAAAYDAPADG
jgi:asparagine synthase (glutamine-hydrolysing)